MLTSGDIVRLDLGVPTGREAGFRHPAVVLTAQPILDARPTMIQVVPLTTTNRGFTSEVLIEADALNRLDAVSTAQCQHVRAVSIERVDGTSGTVGPAVLAQIRETVGLILDIPP